jgi:hypothetical protein
MTVEDGSNRTVVIPPKAFRKEGAKFIPNYTLSKEEGEILGRFREFVATHQGEFDHVIKEFAAEDDCLCRYLRARDWELEKAQKLLLSTLKWRMEFHPEKLHPGMFITEAATGKIYRNGFDKFGRPVCYMRPRLENTKDYANQVRFLVYTLERTVKSMDIARGVESWVWIFDFKGMSIFNATPMSTAKEVLDIIMTCYPERLALAVLVDAPYIFSVFFTAISPLIPPMTKKKLRFCSNAKEKQETFEELFDDLSALESDFGGSTNFVYDYESYWKAEREDLALVD